MPQPRTADDAVDTAMEIVWRLKQTYGLEAVVSTKPPGLEVVLGNYSLRRRVGTEETNVVAIAEEVMERVSSLGLSQPKGYEA